MFGTIPDAQVVSFNIQKFGEEHSVISWSPISNRESIQSKYTHMHTHN